jgi:hypothetical protein
MEPMGLKRRIRKLLDGRGWRDRCIAAQTRLITATREENARDKERMRELMEETAKARDMVGRLMREAAGRPPVEEISRDLANIIQGTRLVECRREALAEKMGLGAGEDGHGRAAAGEEDLAAALAADTVDLWTILSATGTRVTFRRSEGHGPGSCTLVVRPRAPMHKGWEIPVSPKMSWALRVFMDRIQRPLTPGGPACAEGAQIAKALADGSYAGG